MNKIVIEKGAKGKHCTVDVKNIIIDSDIPILMSFRRDLPPIGFTKPFIEDGVIKMYYIHGEKYKDCYPAIGLVTNFGKDGYQKIRSISFSSNPNEDETILSIRDQIEPIEG